MDFNKVEVSSFRLTLIFIHTFCAVLQVTGFCVLYHTSNLRATQRVILINVNLCHIFCSIYLIYGF